MIGSFVRHRQSLFFIVLIALVIRLVVVAFLYQGQLNPRRDHWPFGYETGRIARAIATGRGFSDPVAVGSGPTAWMTPVYPYLVAGVFKLFGVYSKSSALILLALNSLFSALTCIPVFFMARESFGEKTAIWAGWIWGLFPYAVLLSADMIWETCLTALLMTFLFLITLRLHHSTRLVVWAGYGVLWGAAALTNPAVLSLLPFLGGWACCGLYQRGKRWAWQATVTLLALSIVAMPWFTRNYRTFHQFIPFRDGFWMTMHVGNNGDTSHWAPVENSAPTEAEEGEFLRLGELNYMTAKRQETLDFIRRHPGWFVGVTVRRVIHMWTGFWSFPASGRIEEPFDPDLPFDPLVITLFTTLTALAFVGLWGAFARCNLTAWPYAFVLLFFPLVYYVTTGDLRYRHPIDPEIVVLATYACVSRFTRTGEGRESGAGQSEPRWPKAATPSRR
ncbi:MAG: glycosyltransferase family 39 protein [Candidatus Acidiferrales bacterium]